jgi:hypothetical protein
MARSHSRRHPKLSRKSSLLLLVLGSQTNRETQPEAFFLNIYFNAQPLHANVDKEKQRAPNALIPTSIAYAGGQMEFPMDMGSEVSV